VLCVLFHAANAPYNDVEEEDEALFVNGVGNVDCLLGGITAEHYWITTQYLQ
jgi:hypothetical protein